MMILAAKKTVAAIVLALLALLIAPGCDKSATCPPLARLPHSGVPVLPSAEDVH